MRERLAYAFPLIIAALLPIAGLALAALRFGQEERAEAGLILLAALLGSLVWAIVLSMS